MRLEGTNITDGGASLLLRALRHPDILPSLRVIGLPSHISPGTRLPLVAAAANRQSFEIVYG